MKNNTILIITPMDIEQFMLPVGQTFNYDEESHHQLPLDLYDQESQAQDNGIILTVDQVVNILSQRENIVDLPLSEIVEIATDECRLHDKYMNQFVRKIKKNKNILKRSRAKARTGIVEKLPFQQKKIVVFQESSTEKDTEQVQRQIKKQRNRMSAQISRDKKKCYVRNLQMQNRELWTKNQKLRLQNQKLKQNMTSKKQTNQKQTKGQNKFMRLLVLLGIVFFIYLLKDIFTSQSTKSPSSIMLDEECQEESIKNKMVLQGSTLIDSISSQIEEMNLESEKLFAQQGNKNSIKEIIFSKFSQIKKKLKVFKIPSKIALSIMQIKDSFIL